MRKIFTLLAAGLALSASAANEVYETAGDGTIYTFASLAAIPESGVEKLAENTYRLNKDITLSESNDGKTADGLKIENNEVVRFGAKVLVRVYGDANFAVTDTATMCADVAGNKAMGLHLYRMSDSNRTIAHVRFEEVGITLGNPQGTSVESCSFVESNGELSKYAVCFSAACVNSSVRKCYFYKTGFSAVGNGSNVAAGLTIEDNLIVDCSTQGRNYPYLNVVPSGNNGGTYIRRNRIEGGKGYMAGAISVSNMLGIVGENKVVIEDNYMDNCRYGMNIYGSMNARIVGNTILNCHYETNPNNGGSGITFYCTEKAPCKAYVQENHIEGNIWGVSIVGPCVVNLGRTDVAETDADYNPGDNVFKNNGNKGAVLNDEGNAFDPSVPYDLYNNTTLTTYAQGNFWGGPDQTPEEVAKRIFDKADDPKLGEVIYLPVGQSGVGEIADDADAVSIAVSGDGSFTVTGVAEGTNVSVYSADGTTIWSGNASGSVQTGYRGIALVKAGSKTFRVIL